MSYILDALRKADAERDRGNVPGVHAQPSFGGQATTSTPPAAKPWLWLAGGAAAVAVVGGAAWYLTSGSRGAAEVPVATAPTANAPPVAPAIAPPVAFPVAPPPAAPPIAAAPAPAPAPRPEATRKPKPAQPAASNAAVATAPPASPPPAADAKPAASGEKIYTIAELPDDIRRQLPNVAVGGSMYSAKPADRILIINGQVLHEGDRIAPDLTLQQIRLKAAILNFKGYRYTLAF